MAATSVTKTLTLSDDNRCAGGDESYLPNYSEPEPKPERENGENLQQPSTAGNPVRSLSCESRIERAWAHWKKLGQPKLIVAPMVDNSELPFRLLCRKYGADAAYTPMLHSRIFSSSPSKLSRILLQQNRRSPCPSESATASISIDSRPRTASVWSLRV